MTKRASATPTALSRIASDEGETRAASDLVFMQRALKLASRGCGCTSPNPMVGAVLVKDGKIIGEGWHHRAGEPHAEIEAFTSARRRGHAPAGATLFVTLEPCSTHGRTPPCTKAIIDAKIGRIVAGATDPNPKHAGRGFEILRQSRIRVDVELLEPEISRLNEPFNHWIVHKTPFVTLKCAQSLDGKIATAGGFSKWITSSASRGWSMQLRRRADGILVGINTVLADDPSLTFRPATRRDRKTPPLRRFVLDTNARIPLTAKVLQDESRDLTTIIVGRGADPKKIGALTEITRVIEAPMRGNQMDLRWILRVLGRENVTHLLIEGGGEVNFSFLKAGLVQRVIFFYAPIILGGGSARKGIAGPGFPNASTAPHLTNVEWSRLGPDLFMTGRAC